MKLLKKISIIVVISIITISVITTVIDYKRVNNNKKPVFTLVNNNIKNKRQVFTGIIYKVERIYSSSENEKLSDSETIKFKLLGRAIKINDIIKPKENLRINTTESTKCTKSKLQYADKNIKIYTYCLTDIKIISYNKEYTLTDYIKDNDYKKILNRLRFDGITTDKSSLELVDNNKISNNGLKIIQCNTNNINDIYIGPNNMFYQEDFCLNKDDDFKFLWTIVDKHDDNFKCEENIEKEILYEDINNIYDFDCLMSDKIFVNTPAVRGKAELYIPIKEALDNKIVTIDEAIKRGLKINVTKK